MAPTHQAHLPTQSPYVQETPGQAPRPPSISLANTNQPQGIRKRKNILPSRKRKGRERVQRFQEQEKTAMAELEGKIEDMEAHPAAEDEPDQKARTEKEEEGSYGWTGGDAGVKMEKGEDAVVIKKEEE